jgi:hypothetical protein
MQQKDDRILNGGTLSCKKCMADKVLTWLLRNKYWWHFRPQTRRFALAVDLQTARITLVLS